MKHAARLVFTLKPPRLQGSASLHAANWGQKGGDSLGTTKAQLGDGPYLGLPRYSPRPVVGGGHVGGPGWVHVEGGMVLTCWRSSGQKSGGCRKVAQPQGGVGGLLVKAKAESKANTCLRDNVVWAGGLGLGAQVHSYCCTTSVLDTNNVVKDYLYDNNFLFRVCPHSHTKRAIQTTGMPTVYGEDGILVMDRHNVAEMK